MNGDCVMKRLHQYAIVRGWRKTETTPLLAIARKGQVGQRPHTTIGHPDGQPSTGRVDPFRHRMEKPDEKTA
nr:MAG TPA: hypothetical protein [Caudoviricetes sp.]